MSSLTSNARIHRLWPLLSALLAAGLLLWLRPPREVSAALVVLGYLGFCLLIWRRNRQPSLSAGDSELLIAYASQGGQALDLAQRSVSQLRDAGLAAHCLPLNRLQPGQFKGRVLFVVSTYGEGEAPDNGARFARQLQEAGLDLHGLRYAVLGLGDSQYQHFCGFGAYLDRQLQACGAIPLFDRLDVDRCDAGTLRHWQQQLGQLSGRHDFVDWLPASYQRWILTERRCLNPASSAEPVFELSLQSDADMHWQAGDLVEVGPCHAPGVVSAWLARLGFNEDSSLPNGSSLLETLAGRQLAEDVDPLRGLTAAELLAASPLLAHREYSIASVPADGKLQLLVRLMRHADGRPGLGSGWLCEYAEVGQPVALRIRSNPSFHAPAADVPMILIGNGTGLAGLRAHLRERPAGSRNWLLFGERTRAHDSFCAEELRRWLDAGHLQRLELAFSRDQQEKIYVQHLLRDAADELRRWLEDGAALYVCGSLDSMGHDLHQLLLGLLGEEQLHQLADQGRYRRDLY
jgi:sulfite reductase (NADPH) flavoprotein alpha-component